MQLHVNRLNKGSVRLISLAFLLALTLVLTPASVLAAGSGSWTADIGNPVSETQAGIAIAGWGPIEPATSGGNFGGFSSTGEDCRVMWEPPTPSESLRCATVTYTYSEHVIPVSLNWRALNGLADDSYKIYVDGILVYTYTDSPPASDPETWHTFNHDLTSYGLPCQMTHTVQFCATGSAWATFATYGQVAIDWVTFTSGACPIAVGGTIYPIM